MAPIDDLREERTKAKHRVTVAVKRLRGAIERNTDQACINTFVTELERSFCDFEIAHDDYHECVQVLATDNTVDVDEYSIVNGMNMKEYKDCVFKSYNEAIEMYNEFSENKCKEQVLRPDSLYTQEKVNSSQLNVNPFGTNQSSVDKSVPSMYNFPPAMSVSQLPVNVNHGSIPSVHIVNSRAAGFTTTATATSASSYPQNAFGYSASNYPMSSQPATPWLAQSQPLNGSSPYSTSPWLNAPDNRAPFDHARFASPETYIKKFTLPEFSGARRDWPEFQAVWRELAERTYRDKAALAYELKRSLKGEALDKVKNIYITRPTAYEDMWRRLKEHYDDVTASVQAALNDIKNLKPVQEEDYSGLIKLVDSVEGCFAQLEQLEKTDCVTLREVDHVMSLLPSSTRMIWIRRFHGLSPRQQLQPFPIFIDFLLQERAAVVRLAENQKKISGRSSSHHAVLQKPQNVVSSSNTFKGSCLMPSHSQQAKHKTAVCRDFKKLSVKERYKLIKDANACFRCFGNHRKEKCESDKPCGKCSRSDHHTLLCRKTSSDETTKEQPQVSSSEHEQSAISSSFTVSDVNQDGSRNQCSLYPIVQGFVVNGGKWTTIFCDGGSNSSYITHQAANRIKAKRLEQYTLDVTTMGGVEATYNTCLYEFSLRTVTGKIMPVRAFGMEKITDSVSILDESVIRRLFPDYDPTLLQRKSSKVDILLGSDYFGLHPKHEICKAGDHLSIMKGELGICVQGHHEDLVECTSVSSAMAKEVHSADVKLKCFQVQSYVNDAFLQSGESRKSHRCETEVMTTKSEMEMITPFIQGEELGTIVQPRCGGCKCNKCPTVGHTFSFKEQQELDMIKENLKYDEDHSYWVTKYPWTVDPAMLPENYGTALSTLKRMETNLKKDAQWAGKYQEQMEDLLNREVARKLSDEELKTWNGPKFYICHLAVINPRSATTPVRIVFNSSQITHGMSLNAALAKGPDGYMNNLLGLLLRWREENVAVIGDIRKMFNSVRLELMEQHCHRFLWRDMDTSKKPDEYVITRVNMGDKPAPAICTEAMYATADKFKEDNPRAAQMIKHCSYVDDILDSFEDIDQAKNVIKDAENMLAKGGFHIKYWLLSGGEVLTPNQEMNETQEQNPQVLLKGEEDSTRVLGINWQQKEDTITFKVELNFSKKKKGKRTEPHLTKSQVPKEIPQALTRRMVLEQVMMIFDPLGLLCPFTLIAKIYLRDTWTLKLGWDDPLPSNLQEKWIRYFSSMFAVEELALERSLHPIDAVGQPWLILMSDGSDLAYGFVAYVRWKLNDGTFWCRLVMSKNRIAPLTKRSTPQLELNGAVLSKRGRELIEKQMRFSFERIIHIVDSLTVLNMINKISTRFRVYEGVRIGEIQAATAGDMSSWAWMSGQHNTADMLTRGCEPRQLDMKSDWYRGPDILYQPIENWGLKYGLQSDDPTPGEKKVSTMVTSALTITPNEEDFIHWERFSSIKTLRWIVARLLSIAKEKSFRGGQIKFITPEMLAKSEAFILKRVQLTMDTTGSQYKALKPRMNDKGLWILGSRLIEYNPTTPEGEPQCLLPRSHKVTALIMKNCHEESGHRGRDGTVAKFRERFWTPRASKLAWMTKSQCQMCTVRDPKLIEQAMGTLPDVRTKPSPPFSKVMIDLFGPYLVRGEVQKRTTSKAYGVIFTDLVMRAVHIEAAFGYDTESFLMTLSRFASIRGWPEVIYSDPGTQLIGAARELRQAWSKLHRNSILRKSSEKGLHWIFGPADSPWQQGAVESMVKCAKKAINFAIHNQRLSPSEFLTMCAEVSNLINERPIGTIPSLDDNISVLTPNSLLLGKVDRAVCSQFDGPAKVA